MSEDNIKMNEALLFLYNELAHIRRINTMLVLWSLVILIIVFTGKAVDTDVESARQLRSELSGLEDIWEKVMRENTRPKNLPRPEVPVPAVFGDEFGPHLKEGPFGRIDRLQKIEYGITNQNETVKKVLSLISGQTPAINIQIVDGINFSDKTKQDISTFVKLAPEGFNHTITAIHVYWPNKEKPSKIKLRAEFKLPGGGPFPESADFEGTVKRVKEKYHPIRTPLSGGDLDREFPRILEADKRFLQLSIKDAIAEAEREVKQKEREASKKTAPTVELPLGLPLDKMFTVIFFPGFILLIYLWLYVELWGASDYAAYCNRTWEKVEPHFISPWWPGRKGKGGIIIGLLALIVLPGTAMSAFAHAFADSTMLWYAVIFIVAVLLSLLYLVLVQDIQSLCFQNQVRSILSRVSEALDRYENWYKRRRENEA